jgi:hypothetical protein
MVHLAVNLAEAKARALRFARARCCWSSGAAARSTFFVSKRRVCSLNVKSLMGLNVKSLMGLAPCEEEAPS